MNTISLLAEVSAQQPGGLQGLLISFGPFILIIVVMYFLLFRSQQKKNKERQLMLNSVTAGDKILTAGGLIGTVAKIEEKSILLKVAENVKLEISRTAISAVLEKCTIQGNN